MSLVRKLPPTIREVPHEPGNSMSFRPLSGVEVEDAQAGSMREIGDRFPRQTLETFRTLKELNAAEEQQSIELVRGPNGEYEQGPVAAATEIDPLSGYSVRLLLRYSLVAWEGDRYQHEASEANKDDLDPVTRRWAALQVLDVSSIDIGKAGAAGHSGEALSSAAGSNDSEAEPGLRSISELSTSPA